MPQTMNILITGTGSYIPGTIVTNEGFKDNSFYDLRGQRIAEGTEVITEKFENITGIRERRYVKEDEQMSDIAVIAARRAIEDSYIDPETLDGIILAHNFGNVSFGDSHVDIMPSIASRVKHDLKILNPRCIAFDIIFGCPGWIQGLILARQQILIDNAKRILVIGAETLSRVLDPHDRDSMIYADGAAAVILEGALLNQKRGMISTASLTYSHNESYYLYYDKSNKKDHSPETRYLKMHGKKIYEFALTFVPQAMKQCFDKSGIKIDQLKKIFLHQANEKMDRAIVNGFYKLYGIQTAPPGISPMNIHKLGNSSVATIPTLLDMILKNEQPEHKLEKGDVILLASVGAGMNVNAITYIV
jgi:3-oxoacyl-[acyl-carrier-protein] synthase-3